MGPNSAEGSREQPGTGLIPKAYGLDVLRLVAAQLGAVDLLAPAAPFPTVPDRTYRSNEALWADLLSETVWATAVVELSRFRLSEWLPQRPGLFHTPRGQQERRRADSFPIIGAGTDGAALPRFEQAIGRPLPPDLISRLGQAVRVYPPGGKASLLNGGLGCIRLRNKVVDGDTLWFMGASSTGSAHEGFVVAVADDLYARVIEPIRHAGAIECDLTGRLCCIPPDLDPLYDRLVGVPRMYIRVEELVSRGAPRGEALFATGAVTVRSDVESRFGAAFVTFRAGDPRYLQEAADWLSETYVGGVMAGSVVTDLTSRRRALRAPPSA